MAVDLNAKIKQWKQKLLDLGKRNPNLNFKFNKTSTLKIESPDIFTLWDKFVNQESQLSFGTYKEPVRSYFEIPEDTDVEEEEENFNADITTNQSPAAQSKILRLLKKKSSTMIEEQGINVLYLCFGFLRYNDGRDSYDAPIILVPATITCESINAPYILSPHEDEIIINPTLTYKLDYEYGITLPEYNDNEDISSLDYYFDTIKSLVSNQSWKIIQDVGLGLLHFAKLSMYRDIELHTEQLINNKLIAAIAGDTSVEIPAAPIFKDLDSNEMLQPENNYQVVDADSSQQETILCAKKGISFVLQGPPGTGKSQTITNIIAECLAEGKKVLFVSEKMAALQVVFSRLKEVGLEDFCLIMHNNKASKKSIMEQFAEVLKKSGKKYSLALEAYEQLERLEGDKETLNAYARELVDIIEPLNKNIYSVHGELSKLENAPDLLFSFDNVANISRKDLDDKQLLISRFAKYIENMNDDIASNPWYGCTLSMLSNELSQNISSKFKKIIDAIEASLAEIDKISTNLNLKVYPSYNGIKQAINILKCASKSYITPIGWILGADLEPLHDEINSCQEKRTIFTDIRNRIINLHQELNKLDNTLDFSDYNVLSNNDFITAHRGYINNILVADPILECLSKEKQISMIEQALSKLSNDVADFNAYKTKLSDIYEDEIFSIDVNSIYQRFKTDYTWGVFNFIKSSYRSDTKLFKGLLKQFGGSVSNESIIAALADLRSMNKIQSDLSAAEQTYREYFGNSYQGTNTNINLLDIKVSIYKALNACLDELDKLQVVVEAHIKDESILRAHYEHLYQGIDTDWSSVRVALDWAINFKTALGNNIQKNIDFITEVCSTSKFNAVSEEHGTILANWNASINQDYTWIKSLFSNNIDFDNIYFDIIKVKFLCCINNMKQLENWIDYHNCRKQMCESGLSSYIVAIEENNISSHDLLPAFNKRFYKLWLDQVLPSHQAISNFRGYTHEDIINEFKNLDKQQMIIAKYRLLEKLINSLPSTNNMTNGKDEVALLNRELNKQRRIMPIRKLFQKIPNLLLRLKPCLMMSPLTVSLYLESDAFQFDTVIFDEASQICTENAIGAIMRAKQVIIAGDKNQLPPSNFFITSTVGDDEYNNDDDVQNDVFESLINEASQLPSKTLQWHYRSRHEHLITFSNRKFYKNQLITFPSNKEQGIDNGVEYEYVPNGFYDRGGRNGNFIEAQRVADMVFEHFEKCRAGIFNRSLGVITFGEIQATAVETALNMKRREDPEFENYFSEDNEEHFFVKSLENVQGDERDTIIFSIGYARDKDGKMIMAFGPLSKSGGERRLNVAITRAKYNIKLVGSILPTDINLDRINSEGPRLLRAYIDFAKNGVTALDSEIITKDDLVFESPFEEAVYNFLSSKGYKVKTQVGCSSYRIDLAVQHPKLDNIFVLAVECDGASYHSAKTARERDRLRQDVLENMGWKFHRIWSTDWIKDPISEGNRLIQAVEKAILEYEDILTNTKVLPPSDGSSDTKPPVVIEDNSVSSGYNFEEYPDLSYKELFVSEEDIPNKLLYLIKTGYPIHFISLCQEVIVDMGRSKLTTAAKNDVEMYLKKIRTKIIRKDDFFYPKKYTTVHARQIGNRNIEQISQEELCAGILKVLENCIGIKPDDLLQETIKAFGFGRRTVKISTAFEAAYQKLIADKSVVEKAGKAFAADF